MAYYLQSDGVDDVLYYTGATFVFDEIIIDCEVTGRAAFDKYLGTASSGFFQRNGSNQDQWSGNWTAAYINGVLGTNNTSFVPLNQRMTIRVTGTATSNNAFYIFANNSAGGGSMPGKIYSVTVKNAGETLLYWDLTLGNALDQSGHGRNGTIVGAAWVQDASGGIAGTVSYATKQAIQQAGSVVIPTKQVVSLAASVSYATKQAVYQSGSLAVPTKQSINQTGSESLTTKQEIYGMGSEMFALEQVITQGGIPGNASFATRQVLYRSGAADFKTKQTIYRSGSDPLATRQAIYNSGSQPVALQQKIYRTGAELAAIKQILFATGTMVVPIKAAVYTLDSLSYPIAIDIFDADKSIVGRTALRADRALRVLLQASRELRFELRGDVSVPMDNQNFSLYAGESRYLDFTATDNGAPLDITGATIKWVLKKIGAAGPTLDKESGSKGIEITDAANGKFTVDLLPADTASFPAGLYKHEAGIIDVFGHKSPVLAAGTVTLKEGLIK